MTQVGDAQLADGTNISGKGDFAVQDAWGTIGAQDIFEFNAPPGGYRFALNLPQEFTGAAPEGDESDPQLVEQIEIGIGGQLGIKDEVFGKRACALLPKGYELEDFIGLLAFAQLGICVAKHPPVGVLGEESKHAFLSSAPL